MATYTYKCTDCGNTFDIQATIREKEELKGAKFMCPKCRSKNIKHEFSVTNFIKNVFKNDNQAKDCCSKSEKSCCKPKGGNDTCCS